MEEQAPELLADLDRGEVPAVVGQVLGHDPIWPGYARLCPRKAPHDGHEPRSPGERPAGRGASVRRRFVLTSGHCRAPRGTACTCQAAMRPPRNGEIRRRTGPERDGSWDRRARGRGLRASSARWGQTSQHSPLERWADSARGESAGARQRGLRGVFQAMGGEPRFGEHVAFAIGGQAAGASDGAGDEGDTFRTREDRSAAARGVAFRAERGDLES